MKNILNTIKTLLIAGAMTILTIIPVMADANDTNILTHYTNDKGNCITVYKNGTTYTNCNVKINTMDWINNTLTIEKEKNFYTFNVDKADEFYFDETINVTFNDKMEIVDCAVLSEPQVYNTEISQIDNDIATFIVNGNKYTFENTEGSDGWIVGDKCKAVIQNGRLLEVRPIPLAER
jgi:hypothetical protein